MITENKKVYENGKMDLTQLEIKNFSKMNCKCTDCGINMNPIARYSQRNNKIYNNSFVIEYICSNCGKGISLTFLD